MLMLQVRSGSLLGAALKVAVFEMLPEKRRIWMLRYSRSKLSRASRKGTPISAPMPPPPPSLPPVTSLGSMSGSTVLSRSRGVRMIVRSTTLRSWRTWPGQS